MTKNKYSFRLDLTIKQKEIMEIFKFKTKELSPDGRSYIIYIPKNKITKIETIYGGERVELKVNGINVKGSTEDLVKHFEVIDIE